MAWNLFMHSDAAYAYTPERLAHSWARLHAGDAEPFPQDTALQQAWIAYHAGEFEQATEMGLALGMDGYAVANKASCIYADYLETDEPRRLELFEAVAERALRQQREQPGNAAGFFWHAWSLARQARRMPVVRAMAQGFGGKVADSLNRTLKLQPAHADAHVAFGVYHVNIVDKIGPMMGALTYGARKEDGYRHFRTALTLHPDSAIARIEYARALMTLEGDKKMAESLSLFEDAADCKPLDARERLDIEEARKELPD